tara:strand:+ start:536 stop:1513 length:978 start_codon:yes stop_codon:yes gene_type:complete
MKYNIIRLEKITEKDINDLSKKDFMNIKKIKKNIDKYALNTKIQTIMGIKLFIRFKEANGEIECDLLNSYNDVLKDYCNTSKEIIEKNEMTENEEKNWIHYPDLCEKFTKYYIEEFKPKIDVIESNDYDIYNFIRNFLLLALFIELPPTRIGNYQFMKIRIKKKRSGSSLTKDCNYLMDNNDGTYELVFNKYKTAKYLGQITHIIPKDTTLSDIIKIYLIKRSIFVNSKKNTDFLLGKDKVAMSQSNITDTLKYTSRKIIGKNLSVNLFRHIYITHFISLNKSIEDKKKFARFMGQTYDATQMEKYNKKVKKPEITYDKIILTFE